MRLGRAALFFRNSTRGRSHWIGAKHAVEYAILFYILLSATLYRGPLEAGHSTGSPFVGIDCGVGTKEGVVNPSSPPPWIGNGAVDSSCTWSGDADSPQSPDGTMEPLVSDNPESSNFIGPPPTGGGFSAEVRLFNLPPNGACPDVNCVNGFDITLQFDTRYLTAQLIDERGLPFGDRQPAGSGGVYTLVSSLDNMNGTVRLAQVILGVTIPADSNGGVTLFRVRFDVVGVGRSSLHFPCDSNGGAPCDVAFVISGTLVSAAQDGSFDSETFFAPSANLDWNVYWSYSSNPFVPGTQLTLTSTSSCTGSTCGASLSRSWDFESDGVIDAAGTAVTLSPPPPAIARVRLTVNDGAGHQVTASRRLPLVVGVQGPGAVPSGVTGVWTGKVLGGNPPYTTGSWRFCPTVTVAGSPQVCTNPFRILSSIDLSDNTDSQSLLYNFAGSYTNTLTVTDTASREIAASSVTGSLVTTVTGSPAAFAVSVANVPKASAGSMVTVTVSVAYNGDSAVVCDANLNTLFDSGEAVVVGATPPAGTSTKDDSRIKYADSNGNNVRDNAEPVAYDSNSNSFYDTGELVIAGSTPSAGQALTDDSKLQYVDTNNDGVFNSNGYPYSARSSSFSATFDFGDGSTSTLSGGLTFSVGHSYPVKGSYVIRVTAQETGSASPSRISEIRTSSVAINAVALTASFTVAPVSPFAGLSATFTATVSGGTAPYMVSWSFGDGTTGVGSSVSHTYQTGGNKTVVLTVRDLNNASVTVSSVVSVVVPVIPTHGGNTARSL